MIPEAFLWERKGTNSGKVFLQAYPANSYLMPYAPGQSDLGGTPAVHTPGPSPLIRNGGYIFIDTILRRYFRKKDYVCSH